MTREEAISLLRRYRRTVRINPLYVSWGKSDYITQRYVYERYLILRLIERIANSSEPPLRLIHNAYWAVDMFMLESESRYTQRFLRIVERCIGDIMEYLEDQDKKRCGYSSGEDIVLRYFRELKEKEKNEDAENQLERPC